MDRFDDGIRRRGQKAVNVVRTGDRLRLRAAITLELSPDSRKASQRPIIIDCESDDVLFLGLGIWLRRILSKAVERVERH